MLEGTLCFAVVVEAEFVDRAVVDGPGVADVPLLKALTRDGGKTRDVGTGSLELGERGD